jgi:hypothetical protein
MAKEKLELDLIHETFKLYIQFSNVLAPIL